MSRRHALALLLAPLFARRSGAAEIDPAVLLELNRNRQQIRDRNNPATPVAPKPSGIPYHANHRCPFCGYESPDSDTRRGVGTFIVVGNQIAGDGDHKHTCPKCGRTWHHGGHSHAEQDAPFVNPLAAPGCVGGNCPAPTTVRRGFRILR